MPDPADSQVKSDRSTPRVIMVEGVPWVSHEFHERFINEMDAENERLRAAIHEHRACVLHGGGGLEPSDADEALWKLAGASDEAQAPPITAAPSWLAPKLPGGGKPARPSRDSDLTKGAE